MAGLKIRYMKKIKLVIILCAIVSFQATAGGGWVHSKGKGFFKLSEWWVVADKHYIGNGEIDDNITTGLYNTNLYGEYGISDKVNLMLNLPIFSRSFTNDEVSGTTGSLIMAGDAINSIGDMDIGLKYGIIRNKPVVLSASLYLGLPLGKTNGGNRRTLATGDGEFNQILSVQASTSKSIGKFNLFAGIDLGFNNRTKGFSDELRYGLEIGSVFNKRLITILRLQRFESLENSNFVEDNGVSIFASDTEFSAYTYEVAYEIKEKYGITANVGGAFSGRLIFANKSYSIGVYMKL